MGDHTRRKDLLHKSPEALNTYVLCAQHFEFSQFMSREDRDRLIWSAVPTLFNVPNPPKLVTSTRPLPRRRKASRPTPSTSTSHLPSILNPIKRKLTKSPRKRVTSIKVKYFFSFRPNANGCLMKLKNMSEKNKNK